MANMISPLPNDPILAKFAEDPATAATIAGSFGTGGMSVFQDKLQEQEQERQNANQIAREMAGETAGANSDLTQAYLMAEMAKQGAYNSQPQQTTPAQQAPVLQRGLLYPVEAEDAMIQGRPMESVERELALQQPQKPLNQMAREFANQIIKAKALYGEGEKAGNTEAMQYAHEGADRARAALQQLGYDPDAYGFNGDIAQAQQGLANNDLRAMQNILSGDMSRSSLAHYDDTYNYLINQGYSRDIASEVAGQKARSYAVQRTQELENAFNMYGHDGTTINPMGVQILQKLAEEEPDMAGYYIKQFAGPLNEYGKQNAKEMAAIQHQYKGEDRDADQQNRLQAMGYQAQLNAQLKSVQAELDSKARAQDFKYRVMLLDRKAQLDALTRGTTGGSKGASAAQIKVWQEEVKRADDWDKEHLGQEKDNPYRAAANAYKAMIDQSQGLGQTSSGDWAEYGDVPNDFNAFGKWVEAMFDKNAQDGYPRSNAEIIAIAEGVNKDFADNYIDDSYRHPVKSESPPQSQPKAVAIPANEPTEDYGLESGQRGSWGNVFNFDLSKVIQEMRENPAQTEAGRMAMRRYGR